MKKTLRLTWIRKGISRVPISGTYSKASNEALDELRILKHRISLIDLIRMVSRRVSQELTRLVYVTVIDFELDQSCALSHGSWSSSFAVLRSSGAHCIIFLMNCIKRSLSSPCKFVSISSNELAGRNSSSALNFPANPWVSPYHRKNLGLNRQIKEY